ncbi:MAG: hypothetical protein ACRDT2_10700 [Natronosporangium sp.]
MTAPATHAVPRAAWRTRATGLFPDPPPRPVRPVAGLLTGLAVLAGAAVSLLRQPGALDTVWAEDGQVFLADAVNLPVHEALASSYAGYFHTGPRLLAELVALTPAGANAAIVAVAAAAVTAALAVLVYMASAAHLPSPVARVVAAAIVVVPPLAQGDLPNSIANLHWPALYALFWVLLWTPARWPGQALGLATVVLVTTSDILVVALLPLSLVRFAVRRDRYSAALAAVFAAGVALQALGLLSGASDRDTDLNPARAVVGYLLRAVPGALAGSRWLGPDHTSLRWLALAGAAWLLVAVAVFAAWRRLTRPDWLLAGVAIVHSVALYALPVMLSGVATERYAVAPAMLVVVALLALLPPEPGPAGRAGMALVALLAVVCAVNLRVPTPREAGPLWSDELTRARVSCATPGTATASLRLPPADSGWQAELPCRHLRE